MPKHDPSEPSNRPAADVVEPGGRRLENHIHEHHWNYLRALQDACESSQKETAKAQHDYLRSVQDASQQPDAQGRVNDANATLSKALEDVRNQHAKSAETAFRGYVVGLQSALAKSDVNTIDASSLAALSQSALVVSHYVACTVPKSPKS